MTDSGGADPRLEKEPISRCFADSDMVDDRTYDTPSKVTAEKGEVHVDGPDGVDVSLTPEAALETAERLFSGGTEAQGQKVEEQWRKAGKDRRHPDTVR